MRTVASIEETVIQCILAERPSIVARTFTFSFAILVFVFVLVVLLFLFIGWRLATGPSDLGVIVAVFENLFWRKIHVLCKQRTDPVIQDKHQLLGNHVEFFLSLHQGLDGSNRDKAVVPHGVLTLGIQYAWAYDSGQIGDIHLAAGFFVDVREGGNPFQEDE